MESCQQLIQFDTVQTSDEMGSMYSILELVNESNYENAKSNLGTKYAEFFSGNFSQFSEKRTELKKQFSSSGISFSKSNYYHHVLSSTSAKIYAECIARTTNKPISVWVESIMDEEIVIGIKSGLTGESLIEYEIIGEDVKAGPKDNKLTSGSVKNILFDYNKKKDFTLIISGTIKQTGGTESVTITVPKVVSIVKKVDRRTITQSLRCGAGCQNNYFGCEEIRDLKFTADPEFYLLENSIQKVKETVLSGPGVRNYSIERIKSYSSDGQLKEITLHPHNVEGNSPHAQGNIEVEYTIIQERIYLVEEK